MKKKYYILVIIVIINLVLAINLYNMSKQSRDYFTGRIERMYAKDGITTVEVSPVSSKRYFISEIKANHQIKYKLDSISISGLSDPIKNHKKLKMGELGQLVTKYKVGDSIIFKVANKSYDKNEYNLKIDELAIDQTLE